MKKTYPTEHIEQVTFINWFRMQHSHALIFSIPNGELRAISVAQRLKAEGVVSGIPDGSDEVIRGTVGDRDSIAAIELGDE